ncbi:MAG: group II intron reverse transcriptase domain-containing protein [Candidatus Yanofskybacteria bacterium]|nr:group II intron reverse transcriptase domain-containing protein [Candidatus Yanofskybacteria bacterium]
MIGKVWLGGGLHSFDTITSVENLLGAWQEFVRGKKTKPDVQEFGLGLMDAILTLHDDLVTDSYHHSPYLKFRINDPKPRDISKTIVRDRLLHHALYRVLYPFFDGKFIADSYSCRVAKGAHRALNRFRAFACQVSKNHTRTCWVLTCDIRKFFASIDHGILNDILEAHISDPDTLGLLSEIIESFSPGLPLGNLTSQLLVNIYMNEFDQFAKRQLKTKHYIRYADDFVFLHQDKGYLEELLPRVGAFLSERLKLNLHPKKVSITTLASGIDFLGWVHFPDHRVLRTTTKRRMIRRVVSGTTDEQAASYRGLLSHGNTKKLISLLPASGA